MSYDILVSFCSHSTAVVLSALLALSFTVQVWSKALDVTQSLVGSEVVVVMNELVRSGNKRVSQKNIPTKALIDEPIRCGNDWVFAYKKKKRYYKS